MNLFLSSGVLPGAFKRALVSPLLKKSTLDRNVYKNYRPVSNLAFVSKIIEKVVADRFASHLLENNMSEPMQSAYRQHHSTETALMRVSNDLLCALDDRKCAILVLLDLSAAFDTIDHGIMVSRLRERFGINGTALQWFTSYLQDRCQCIHLKGDSSDPSTLHFGVPQGSVIGPIMFTAYTAPLGDIVRRHSVRLHLYADDTQLYTSFDPTSELDAAQAIKRIQDCVSDIRLWMYVNKLKLNEDKTEVLGLCSRTMVQHFQRLVPFINIGDSQIRPTVKVKNIGVWLDQGLTMKSQVLNLCKVAYFGITCISRIRHFLDKKTTESLVHAYVTSRIDNGNGLLYGILDQLRAKLQKVQNAAARVVTRTKRHEHITPVLIQLHWLPVAQRIQYKILLTTFRALHGLSPNYLAELLTVYQPARSLRSADSNLLNVPKTRLRTFRRQGICVLCPIPLESTASKSAKN